MFDKSLLSEKVAANIEKMVMDKRLKSGDKLPNEIELSEELNVSRSTVREAIKILVSNNVLEVRRGKGTFVAENPGIVKDPLGVKFMDDKDLLIYLFETRLIIEPEIAAHAAAKIDDEELVALRKHFRNMREAIEDGKDHSEHDKEFHNVIAKSTKNPVLNRIMPIITDSVIAGYLETKDIPRSGEIVIANHAALLEAMESRDPDMARSCMRDIIEYGFNSIKKKYR